MSQQQNSVIVRKFSERLRARMNRLNLQQNEVAERMGVAPSAVSNWLNGANNAKGKSLRRLAQVLECDPVWLSGGDRSVETISPDPGTHSDSEPLVMRDSAGDANEGSEISIRFSTSEPKAAQCITHLADYLNQVGADRDRLSWLLIELRDRYKVSPAPAVTPEPAKIHGASSIVAEKIRALGPVAVAKARAAAQERELKSPTDEHTGDK